MSGTHFYLTLPSNAFLNIFPNNKTTSYLIKLPQIINLEDNREAGLYSISYPNTWYTLQHDSDTHIYFTNRNGLYMAAKIDFGYYHSVQDLIKAMNKVLAKDISDNIKLTYNSVSGKVTVQLKSRYQFFLNERLSIVFGFIHHDQWLKVAPSFWKYCFEQRKNFVGDVLAGKKVKEPAKARAKEAASTAKNEAINKLHTMTKTGNGKQGTTTRKKRKSSQPATRSKQTKKRKTSHKAEDIFG